MTKIVKHLGRFVVLAMTLALGQAGAQNAAQNAVQSTVSWPAPHEGDFVIHNFRFQSGEITPEVRIHYTTLGTPVKDDRGRATNAVLILHGTGGTGHQFLRPIFAGVLFGPGQLLDASKYYIILPDNIGHGKSSKPSDGMHARFPQYDYADMVSLQHELLEKGLGVDHLRLVLGTSMGCMHSWMWGEAYPDEMDALMPLACLPVGIAGRNRLWRKMIIDGIRQDPEWKNGEYTSEPRAALQIAADFLLIAGSAPLHMQQDMPTRDAADKYLEESVKRIDGRARCQRHSLCGQRFAQLRPVIETRFDQSAGNVHQLRRRLHQSAGIGDRGTRNQEGEERQIHIAAHFRRDARSRHPHLGGGVAAVFEGIARTIVDTEQVTTM